MADDKSKIPQEKGKQEIPQERGRTQKEVSEDIQSAGYDARNPTQPEAEVEEPSLPEPEKLTPGEMTKHPDEFLEEEASNKDGDRF